MPSQSSPRSARPSRAPLPSSPLSLAREQYEVLRGVRAAMRVLVDDAGEGRLADRAVQAEAACALTLLQVYRLILRLEADEAQAAAGRAGGTYTTRAGRRG
jgi:hypothetical protein